ncbi:MAG: guanylate kinase [Christensenellales bacterium]
MKKGLLIVISGPSGAGKGTVYNEVLIRRPEIQRSISVTTRAPRKGEVDGVHYYFRTEEQYQKMIADGALETAAVYSNYYGTPKAPVYEKLAKGQDVMFEMIRSARNRSKIYPDAVTIFIIPPSFEVLEKRLAIAARTRREYTPSPLVRKKRTCEIQTVRLYRVQRRSRNGNRKDACDNRSEKAGYRATRR